MMGKALFLGLFFVLLVNAGEAQVPKIEEITKPFATAGSDVQFNLSISQAGSQQAAVYFSVTPNWIFFPNPQMVVVEPNEVKTITLAFRAPNVANKQEVAFTIRACVNNERSGAMCDEKTQYAQVDPRPTPAPIILPESPNYIPYILVALVAGAIGAGVAILAKVKRGNKRK